MQASLLDRSLYFRGLLILIRQDREIREQEKNLVLRIGAAMGFEKNFCKNILKELMDNTNLDDTPPVFSHPDIARFFIHDGFILAAIDKEIHESELAWLQKVAAANHVDLPFLRDGAKQNPLQTADRLEDRLLVKDVIWR